MIENKFGTIMRRLQEQRSPSMIVSCTKCSQFISKRTLYRHGTKCQEDKTSSNSGTHKRNNAMGIAKFMLANKKGTERYVQLLLFDG